MRGQIERGIQLPN